MPVPEAVERAVAELRTRTHLAFAVGETPVQGTNLHVVYTLDFPLPDRYVDTGSTAPPAGSPKCLFGFRVPANYPDAGPEDSFFLAPVTLRLREPDPKRQSSDIHRAGVGSGILRGTLPEDPNVLVFSWHLWGDRKPWSRRANNLVDHYTHCLRRFEAPEHD